MGRPGLPESDTGSGEPVEGNAIILYLNGDKYVGHVKGGKKHGLGMYVYADHTAYKGHWVEDIMNGLRHPVSEEQRSEQVLRLHRLNEGNQNLVEALKLFSGGNNRPPQASETAPAAPTSGAAAGGNKSLGRTE